MCYNYERPECDPVTINSQTETQICYTNFKYLKSSCLYRASVSEHFIVQQMHEYIVRR